MTSHDPMISLKHMREFARKALLMADGKSVSDLAKDEMLRLALTHLVELIGEAAGRVPRETQLNYPKIPWDKIIGIRNRLIHGYDFIDYDILWDTIINNLPPLLNELESIIQSGD